MRVYELAALAIVALYVVGRAGIDREPRALLRRFGLLVAASWASEQSAISAYDAYEYARSWSIFVGDVPLSVVLIWPCVIHGGWDLASSLGGTRGAEARPRPRAVATIAVAGALLVLGDASLIEPIAVRAGLWAWRSPGLFEVPLIGLLGWGLHAGGCIALLERCRATRSSGWAELWIVLVAPAVTHVGLLAAWWGALRWLPGTVPGGVAMAFAWLISVGLVVAAVRRRAEERVERVELWLRVPAASFFLVLLLLHGRSDWALVGYAAAFVPPWLALLRRPSSLPARLDALGPGG